MVVHWCWEVSSKRDPSFGSVPFSSRTLENSTVLYTRAGGGERMAARLRHISDWGRFTNCDGFPLYSTLELSREYQLTAAEQLLTARQLDSCIGIASIPL